MAKSPWNTQGWTVQKFLAPKTVLFYDTNWALYLNDCSPNYKESAVVMQELPGATGTDTRALVGFRPEMRGTREKGAVGVDGYHNA